MSLQILLRHQGPRWRLVQQHIFNNRKQLCIRHEQQYSTRNEAETSSNSEIPIPPPSPKKSWLTNKIETSPTARWWFTKVADVFGYNSPKQVAGRRCFALYSEVCARAPEIDQSFWQHGMFCLIPILPLWLTFF